jgi:hypothetical protein
MNAIANLCKSLGYLEIHGVDMLITLTIIVVIFFLCGYTSYQGLLANIRADWENQRCVPIYMPFAGYIMPIPGKTKEEATSENVNYCIKKDVSAVFSIALLPLELSLYIMVEFLDNIEEAIRSVMATIRYLLNKLTEERDKIYNKIASVVVPIVEILLYVRDALAKANGVMTVSLYTVMNIYNIIVSGSINLMKILSNLIISITAIMIALSAVALALIPTPATALGISMYASAVVMLVGTIIPNIIIYTMMRLFINTISTEKTSKPPPKPKLKKKK